MVRASTSLVAGGWKLHQTDCTVAPALLPNKLSAPRGLPTDRKRSTTRTTRRQLRYKRPIRRGMQTSTRRRQLDWYNRNRVRA